MSPIRVLQSFPHKIGAARICTTAWHQAEGVAAAGADLLVMPGAVHRPLPDDVRVRPTLAIGRARMPYKVVGRARALALHDRIVARTLVKHADQVDIVHAWPMAAKETLKTARRLRIPTVLERPNAHTRFAYEVVQAECDRLGVPLPADHEHAFNADYLRLEEEEYALADRMLCPSDFVVKTFRDQGFAPERLVRHFYGFDESLFHPADTPPARGAGLTVLFVGVCAVRKGVHFALEAWLNSPASESGKFLIAGEFLPEYEARLAPMLAHPSVEVLGHRNDVPELMRTADALVLPSIEEGFGLVCTEAMASGAIPLVSDACTDVCDDGENAFVHHVGDVAALTRQLTALHEDPALVERMRAACLASAPELTWPKAGVDLVRVYGDVIADVRAPRPSLARAA